MTNAFHNILQCGKDVNKCCPIKPVKTSSNYFNQFFHALWITLMSYMLKCLNLVHLDVDYFVFEKSDLPSNPFQMLREELSLYSFIR